MTSERYSCKHRTMFYLALLCGMTLHHCCAIPEHSPSRKSNARETKEGTKQHGGLSCTSFLGYMSALARERTYPLHLHKRAEIQLSECVRACAPATVQLPSAASRLAFTHHNPFLVGLHSSACNLCTTSRSCACVRSAYCTSTARRAKGQENEQRCH